MGTVDRELLGELYDMVHSVAEFGFGYWGSNLGRDLWLALHTGREGIGDVMMPLRFRSTLLRLSQRLGGWIVFDKEYGPALVPLAAWESILNGKEVGAALSDLDAAGELVMVEDYGDRAVRAIEEF